MKSTSSFIFFLTFCITGCSSLSEKGVSTSLEAEKSFKKHHKALRVPSSLLLGKSLSCFSQLAPVLREGAEFSDEAISPQNLHSRGLIDLDEFEAMKTHEYWRSVVSREDMAQRDEELGFMALSIIKKRYPEISDEALKDRYEVIKSFCGHSI